MTGIQCQVYEHGGSYPPGEGKVVLCIACKRGCHSISCSQLAFRTDVRAKRVLVRVCDTCRINNPASYSEIPPREAITASGNGIHGRIYRTRN